MLRLQVTSEMIVGLPDFVKVVGIVVLIVVMEVILDASGLFECRLDERPEDLLDLLFVAGLGLNRREDDELRHDDGCGVGRLDSGKLVSLDAAECGWRELSERTVNRNVVVDMRLG